MADGEDVQDLIPDQSPIRIAYYYLGQEHHSVGEKRNFGCQVANHEWIANWDDDDVYSTNRLAEQTAVALANRWAHVIGFNHISFHDDKAKYEWHGSPDRAAGASLLFWKPWWTAHRFPYVNLGEDNVFVAMAAAAHVLHAVDGRHLLSARIHAGNTSPQAGRHDIFGV